MILKLWSWGRFCLCSLIGISLAIIIAGCTPKTKLQILKPAKIDSKGVKRVAIGNFELVTSIRRNRKDRDGECWLVESTAEGEQIITPQSPDVCG